MSKAFVSEDAVSEERALKAPPKLAPGEKRYITPDGYGRLERALAEAQARLSSAGAGDSERPQLEERVRLLTATLAVLTVVPPPPSPPDRAVFGGWVELEDEDGARLRYRVVGPDEVDAKAGLVSAQSPIGRAVLGRAPGDDVRVETPRGAREYTVVSVSA